MLETMVQEWLVASKSIRASYNTSETLPNRVRSAFVEPSYLALSAGFGIVWEGCRSKSMNAQKGDGRRVGLTSTIADDCS